jgi:hypothetical protein
MSGGGSGGGSEPDREYNARMATIAEAQQAMAEEMYQYWKSGPGHWENVTTEPTASQGTVVPVSGGASVTPAASSSAKPKMNAKTNDPDGLFSGGSGLSVGNIISKVPAASTTSRQWVKDPGGVSYQDMEQAQMKANMELIPKQTGLMSVMLDNQTKIAPKYFDEAMKGVNVGERVSLARADVESEYANAEKNMRRMASTTGINPASNRYLSGLADLSREKAAAKVGATSLARRQAEEENFLRLSGAMGLSAA